MNCDTVYGRRRLMRASPERLYCKQSHLMLTESLFYS